MSCEEWLKELTVLYWVGYEVWELPLHSWNAVRTKVSYMLKAVSGVEEAQGEEGGKQGQVLNVQEAGF